MLSAEQAKVVADAILRPSEDQQRADAAWHEARLHQGTVRKRRAIFGLIGGVTGASVAYMDGFRENKGGSDYGS